MKKIITIARLKQIANAIRQKTNKTGALTLAQMPAEINSIIPSAPNLGKFSDLKIFIPTSITQAQWEAGYDSMKLLLESADVKSLTFKGCKNLINLDLSFWDGGKRTDMEYMFYDCQALTSLDLSSFNTANVTSMGGMFFDCQTLTSLDLSSFNTANVTNMANMFVRCSKLSIINWPAVWSLAKYTKPFDLSSCPLNHDSCLALFNALQDCNGRTVKLSTTTKSYMSADELKIATDKGVTIA